jgi:hypothetical protein
MLCQGRSSVGKIRLIEKCNDFFNIRISDTEFRFLKKLEHFAAENHAIAVGSFLLKNLWMDTSWGYEKKCETFSKSFYLRGIQSVVGVAHYKCLPSRLL